MRVLWIVSILWLGLISQSWAAPEREDSPPHLVLTLKGLPSSPREALYSSAGALELEYFGVVLPDSSLRSEILQTAKGLQASEAPTNTFTVRGRAPKSEITPETIALREKYAQRLIEVRFKAPDGTSEAYLEEGNISVIPLVLSMYTTQFTNDSKATLDTALPFAREMGEYLRWAIWNLDETGTYWREGMDIADSMRSLQRTIGEGKLTYGTLKEIFEPTPLLFSKLYQFKGKRNVPYFAFQFRECTNVKDFMAGNASFERHSGEKRKFVVNPNFEGLYEGWRSYLSTLPQEAKDLEAYCLASIFPTLEELEIITRVVQGEADIAVDVMGKLVAAAPAKNVMFSPSGPRKTLQFLMKVILPESPLYRDLREYLGRLGLQNSSAEIDKVRSKAFVPSTTGESTFALMQQELFKGLLKARLFEDRAGEFYVNETRILPFGEDLRQEVAAVNALTAKRTFGLVPKVLKTKDLEGRVFMFVDALATQVKWRTSFSEDTYFNFYTPTGTVQVLGMTHDNMKVWNWSNFYGIPCRSGEWMIMDTKYDGRKTIMTDEEVRAFYKNSRETEYQITMPQLKSHKKTNLLEPFKSFLGEMFPFADRTPGVISLLDQDIDLVMDKEGAKVVVVTSMVGTRGGPHSSPRLLIDHPFSWTINAGSERGCAPIVYGICNNPNDTE